MDTEFGVRESLLAPRFFLYTIAVRLLPVEYCSPRIFGQHLNQAMRFSLPEQSRILTKNRRYSHSYRDRLKER